MTRDDSVYRRVTNFYRRLKLSTNRRMHLYGMHVKKHVRPQGVVPDFLIIGAMKCGTTTLFRMIEQHPGFLPPNTKEVQYFNQPRNHARGEAWYRAHFPDERRVKKVQGRLGYRPLTGEATPAMSTPMYAQNVARLLPDVKMVVSLRNPVDRAWSHYQHYRRHPSPDLADFEAALQREMAWKARGEKLTEENFWELAPRLHRLGYISRGQYAEQLERWFEYFPREQFLILNFDDWVHDPRSAACQLADHVGLPPHEFHATQANPGRYREVMPVQCRELLTEFFRPWNRRLFELLGEDWGWPC